MNKTTDDILKEFREEYCKHDEDEIIHIKSGVQLEIEQFIKEALERVREETIEEVKTSLIKYADETNTWWLGSWIENALDKLKANKPEATQTTALAITKKCPLHQCLNCGVISKPSE